MPQGELGKVVRAIKAIKGEKPRKQVVLPRRELYGHIDHAVGMATD